MKFAGVRRIVSGGQTGVDRAALDVARRLGIDHGGWCPAGRWAEDGPIPASYPLRPTPSADPAVRTGWNVRDSDATLVLVRGEPSGGTATTLDVARAYGRPVLVLDPARPETRAEAVAWIAGRTVRTLNVAGPRESECPGAYHAAYGFLLDLFTAET